MGLNQMTHVALWIWLQTSESNELPLLILMQCGQAIKKAWFVTNGKTASFQTVLHGFCPIFQLLPKYF